jgi:ribosomal protein L37AE/L43A
MGEIQITQHDKCPACGKKLVNLLKERDNLLLCAPCGAVICQCGCHYEPKALIDAKLKRSRSSIIPATGDDFKLVRKP